MPPRHISAARPNRQSENTSTPVSTPRHPNSNQPSGSAKVSRVRGVVGNQMSSSKPPSAVKAYCAKCGNCIGEFYNSWVSVTKSYHLPTLPGSYQVEQLKPSGISQAALTGTELTGAEVSSMFCDGCELTLAIECTSAPSHRSIFKGQLFFKLPKLILRDAETGEIVAPKMDDVTIDQLQLSSQRSQPVDPLTRTESKNLDRSRSPENVNLQSPTHAMAPVQTPAGLETEVIAAEEIPVASEPLEPAPGSGCELGSDVELENQDMIEGDVFPSDRASRQIPHSFEAELRRQADQLDRIEQTLHGLENTVQFLQEKVSSPHHEQIMASLRTFDSVFESMVQAVSKAGMIDSLQLGLQLLKQRVAQLENGGMHMHNSDSGSGNPSWNDHHHRSRSSASSLVPPLSQFKESARLASMRSTSPTEAASPPSKRPRNRTSLDSCMDQDDMDEDLSLESYSGLLDSFCAGPSGASKGGAHLPRDSSGGQSRAHGQTPGQKLESRASPAGFAHPDGSSRTSSGSGAGSEAKSMKGSAAPPQPQQSRLSFHRSGGLDLGSSRLPSKDGGSSTGEGRNTKRQTLLQRQNGQGSPSPSLAGSKTGSRGYAGGGGQGSGGSSGWDARSRHSLPAVSSSTSGGAAAGGLGPGQAGKNNGSSSTRGIGGAGGGSARGSRSGTSDPDGGLVAGHGGAGGSDTTNANTSNGANAGAGAAAGSGASGPAHSGGRNANNRPGPGPGPGDALKQMFPHGVEARKRQLDPAIHFRTPKAAEL